MSLIQAQCIPSAIPQPLLNWEGTRAQTAQNLLQCRAAYWWQTESLPGQTNMQTPAHNHVSLNAAPASPPAGSGHRHKHLHLPTRSCLSFSWPVSEHRDACLFLHWDILSHLQIVPNPRKDPKPLFTKLKFPLISSTAPKEKRNVACRLMHSWKAIKDYISSKKKKKSWIFSHRDVMAN